MQGVYEIRNTVNGKKYVGSSIDIEKRWREHRHHLNKGAHGNSHLQAAWDKYGSKVFAFRVIEQVDDIQSLVQREQWWLDNVRASGAQTYNVGDCVDCPTRGIQFNAERKAELSIRTKQLWEDPDYRTKTTAAHIGRVVSEETRRKMSEAHTGQKPTAQAIEASRRAIEHKWRNDEEYCKKMSRLMAERWQDPEFRANMAEISKSAHAKPCPAFIHRETREIIPPGVNLTKACQERGLRPAKMNAVKNGKRQSHRGWVLIGE